MAFHTHPLDLPRVTVDFETKSELSVKDVGAWAYAQHPSTDVMCLSFKFGHEPSNLWLPGQPFPTRLLDYIKKGYMFEAHNAQFERAVWILVMKRKYGVPVPKRWCDTLATCAYRSLPLALDKVGGVLKLSIQKDDRGKYLLNRLCKPRKLLKAEKKALKDLGIPEKSWPIVYVTDENLLRELHEYCLTDSDAEHCLSEAVGDLTKEEYRIWMLDQEINQRGVQVDVDAVSAAIGVYEILVERMTQEIVTLTEGLVQTGGQRDKILEWLKNQGLDLPNLQKETVGDSLKKLKKSIDEGRGDLVDIHRVLWLRKNLSYMSPGKLYKIMACLCRDLRLRGLLQYHGAGTGRWAGRLFQPQNLPRGSLEDYCDMLGMGPAETMELLMSTIMLGGQEALDALEMIFGDPMEAIITSIRGMLVAALGKVFRVADFSAVEAVVNAWLAGEEWKVEAFRAIQRGEKYEGADDIYCAAAAKVFGYVVTKKGHKKERQVGKVCELAFGYQGGVGAWRNFDSSENHTDEEVDKFKVDWRSNHPNIVSLWYGLQDAAMNAVKTGKRCRYGMTAYEVVEDAAGKWLTCILPNGRRLWYYNPWIDKNFIFNQWRDELRYEGRDNKRGGVWGVIRAYGGLLCENVVQAISRDLMAEAMVLVDERGYRIVLTVHDEIMSEDDEKFGSQEEFERLMSTVPKWAEGCPVGVDGWEGRRYRK